MSLNPDIIQFVTDTTARIHQNYPAATQQQRLILDKNTGQVFWDVDYTRYKVNTTPKISYTVNQDSDALVTGSAVFIFVQGIADRLQKDIADITLTVDKQLSPVSTNPVQNKTIKAGIDLALSDAKQYTDSIVNSSVAQLRSYASQAASGALSDAKQYIDSQSQLVSSRAAQYTDSKYQYITSTYIPISSIAQAVQLSDTNIPTGGAVYSFVQSSIAQIQPQSQSLVGLIDTDIVGPADGQVLAYNSNTSKWYNKTIQSGTAGISWTMYV